MSRCPPDRVVYDLSANAYICSETGEVIDDHPITQDAGMFNEGEEPPVPVNIAIHDYGIGGEVSYLKYSEARMVTIYHVLGEMSKKLGFPRYVVEEASMIIRMLDKKGSTVGRRRNEMIAAVLYASARRHGLVVSFKELCKTLGVSKSLAWKFYKSIVSELGLKQAVPPLQEYVKQKAMRARVRVEEIWGIVGSLIPRIPDDLRFKNPDTVAQAVLLLAVLIKKGASNCDIDMLIDDGGLDYCPEPVCGEGRGYA